SLPMRPSPPRSTLLPYTTLFRSQHIANLILSLVAGRMIDDMHLRNIGGEALIGGSAAVECQQRQHCLLNFRTIVNAAPGEHYRRSEEHTSELQSRENLVCRLLLE